MFQGCAKSAGSCVVRQAENSVRLQAQRVRLQALLWPGAQLVGNQVPLELRGAEVVSV